MLICESCNKEHNGTYASGRFCSSSCAKSFSTKSKRKEINEAVRKKLSKPHKQIEKTCPICGTMFLTVENGKKTCSRKCGHISSNINGTGIKHKAIKDTSRMGGLRQGGGKSKQIPYTNWLGFKMALNKEEIEVAKILDEKKLNWNRNKQGFPYLTREGKQRKYYPDFVIDDSKYVEYKGWVTEEMEWKMKQAQKTNFIDLSIIVGTDTRYQRFGINLVQFKNEMGF